MKFFILINVKMPTIVGILTFISMINTISERLKARNIFIFQDFSFYELLKIYAELSEHEKSFTTYGPDHTNRNQMLSFTTYFLN